MILRPIAVSLSVFATACSATGLDSPTSPTSAAVSSVLAGPGDKIQTQVKTVSDLPFKGAFTGHSSAVVNCPPMCPPTTITISGTYEGTAAHLGRFSATSLDVVDMATSTSTGTIDFTAANGDHLFTTTAGGEESFTPPNIGTVRLVATITDGTGRFAGATGSFTVLYTQEIDYASATASIYGDLQGDLTLNK